MDGDNIIAGKEREIIIIAAMAENRVIGKNNALPFTVKGNLARFKEMTMGWPCIIGRKTWESLPKKPLPGRLNIIISATMRDITPDRAHVLPDDQNAGNYVQHSKAKICSSIQDAVKFCSGYEKIFICGGESIYRQSLEFADKIDLTLVPGQYEGDVFFPEIGDNWEKTETVNFNDFSVITYLRKRFKS